MTFLRFDADLQQINNQTDLHLQRTFSYGDGHFTTIKVEQAQLVWWPLHLQRLIEANQLLAIMPIDWRKLELVCIELAQKITEGVIKIQVSRGSSERGYGYDETTRPNVFISTTSLDLAPLASLKAPLSLTFLDFKLGLNPHLSGLKHCNRIEQVLIQKELLEKELAEGLVMDLNDQVIESSKGNLFWYEKGHWYTPSLESAGVDGVTKKKIMQLMPNILFKMVSKSQFLELAESAFICNSLQGLTPLGKVANKQLSLTPVSELHNELISSGAWI